MCNLKKNRLYKNKYFILYFKPICFLFDFRTWIGIDLTCASDSEIYSLRRSRLSQNWWKSLKIQTVSSFHGQWSFGISWHLLLLVHDDGGKSWALHASVCWSAFRRCWFPFPARLCAFTRKITSNWLLTLHCCPQFSRRQGKGNAAYFHYLYV